MRHAWSSLTAATLLAIAGTASAGGINVMTQNQYVGMDLIALVTPGGSFDDKVFAALQDRAASQPTERAKALAKLISDRGPTLVALQEVYKFTCLEIPAVSDGKGCDDSRISGAFTDQLADTLAALGSGYVAAATVVDLDLPAGLRIDDGSDDGLPLPGPVPGVPITVDGVTMYIGVMDRDVILARSDITTSVVPFTAICPNHAAGDGCNYQTVASATVAVAGLPPLLVKFQRGFVGVDAKVGQHYYRFINTHLETRLEAFGPQGRFYQSAQAGELLQTALASLQAMPPPKGARLMLVGDMNSDPRDEIYPSSVIPPGYPSAIAYPPYQLYTKLGGFTDAWTKRKGARKNKEESSKDYTCCQWEDLSNEKSELYERIDLIFVSPAWKVGDAKVLGTSAGDKTTGDKNGLWPSDHASVAVRLKY